jgi:hypothetical protein
MALRVLRLRLRGMDNGAKGTEISIKGMDNLAEGMDTRSAASCAHPGTVPYGTRGGCV